MITIIPGTDRCYPIVRGKDRPVLQWIGAISMYIAIVATVVLINSIT